MKPILLKITAFGPFAKTTELNFKEDLAGQDIFVVTGPTGAGKTTIFDAMCYALYGETSGGKRTGKELRSDYITADEIRTVVEFTFSVKGKTYELMRSPSYLRKKKRGEGFVEVSSEQSLKEVGSTEAPLTKGGEIDTKIKEVLGLDAKQFRKIVMIPQGDFKEFLMANTSDKEQILRQIFGTDLFRRLQESLDKQAKSLKQNVIDTEKQIRAQFKSFKGREELELSNMLNNNEQIKTLLEVCENDLKTSVAEVKSRQGVVDALKLEQLAVQTEYETASKISDTFTQLDKALSIQDKLNEQKTHFVGLSSTINLAKLAEEVGIEEKVVEEKQRTLTQTNTSLENSLAQLQLLQKAFDEATLQYKTVQDLESQISKHSAVIQELSSFEVDVINLKQHRDQVERLSKKLSQASSDLAVKVEMIQSIQQTVNQMDELQREINVESEALGSLQLKLQTQNQLEKQVATLRVRLASYITTQAKVMTSSECVKRVSTQYEELKTQHSEMATLLMSSEVIRLARELKVDMPCPVCGSTNHPNPAPTDVEVPTVEMVQAKYEEVEVKQKELQRVTNQEAEVLQKVASDKEQLQSLFSDLTLIFEGVTFEAITPELVNAKEIELKSKINDLNTQKMNHQKQVSILQATYTEAKVQKDKLEVLQAQHDELQTQVSDSKIALKEEQTLVGVIESRVPISLQDVTVLKQAISVEQQQHTNKVQQKEMIMTTYQKLSTEVAGCESKVEQLRIQQVNHKEELKAATEMFNTCLLERFESHDNYCQGKLSKAEIGALESQVKAYDNEVYSNNQKISDLQIELKGKDRQDLTVFTEKLEALRAEVEGKLADLSAKQTTNRHNNDLLDRIKDSYEGIKKQEEQYAIVGDLAEMANGKGVGRMTFETYVLSSYFDEVLQQANQRLQKMTAKRYYLLRREEVRGGGKKGLDLDVYDAHTCKTRAVNTLSGGESFKASLALALGLADTVQFNAGGIQLDTMFIDEGFGTLDSESLDQAIDILMDLQDNGRLIGVISHVAELKQQIPAKLIVESSPSGSSAYFNK